MQIDHTRRDAIKAITGSTIAATIAASLPTVWPTRALAQPEGVPPESATTRQAIRISLAQWSLHKPLYAGELNHLDFAAEARSLGIDAIEYVNSFFKDKANNQDYLAQMNQRAKDQGVQQLLIMCDGEGSLGDPSESKRQQTIDNHRKWLDAARTLGCHAIRVNAASAGSFEEQQKLAADGLNKLCQAADPYNLNVIIENHGGYSSNGKWLAGVIKMADHPRAGTLPDFGNFCMDWSRSSEPAAWYDRYQGVDELMPYAKAVSAKSHAFDEQGNETGTDYQRMIDIVRKHHYTGWIGIEYEGDKHPPREGIRLTRDLLQRVLAATS